MTKHEISASLAQIVQLLQNGRLQQEGAAVEGPPAMGPFFTMGISFSVRVKAHVPKTIRKKK